MYLNENNREVIKQNNNPQLIFYQFKVFLSLNLSNILLIVCLKISNQTKEVLFANITNQVDNNLANLNAYTPIDIKKGETLEIEFTYSVTYYYTNSENISFEKDAVFE